MAILNEIRKRPYILIGFIALGLLSFLINPDSLDKLFSKNPNVLGKVNGEEITRQDLEDEVFILQQQNQNLSHDALEQQGWEMLVQSKLIKQQFDKLGLQLDEDMFWNQIQYDPIFAKNQQLFDEKGNFRTKELKSEIEKMQNNSQAAAQYQNWLKMRKSIEYNIMARQVFTNMYAGITTNNKEAAELLKERDQIADINYVKVDYASFAASNPVKVTTQDLSNYITKHPIAFQTKESRNIGVVLFRAKASEQDQAQALGEITKLNTVGTNMGSGVENFQNTKQDSMFVTVNSDIGFNGSYQPLSNQPENIHAFLSKASTGQTFGPYKFQDHYYIVSKLMAKKPIDSILSKHILISFKGNQAGAKETRTKEQAKKLADSIGAVVKANPSKFAEFLKYSADPGSAAQGGGLGWTTNDTPFVPEFKTFLATHTKGSIGVVETQFGYHIIDIEDKKSTGTSYKVANLVKEIKPSKETIDKVYSDANKFIQEVQGKSFNEFANIAKKQNYTFVNDKLAQRFDGQIQGIGTDKDSEVLAWAFDKKTNIGDTNIFTSSNQDYIVAYENGKQQAGTADAESVRDQVEPIVKNQLLAKAIGEKINALHADSLDKIATAFSTQIKTAQTSLLSPQVDGANEPKVAGASFGVANGKISSPVEANTGVFVVKRTNITDSKKRGEEKQTAAMISQQMTNLFGQGLLKSLESDANIKDYRNEIYSKANNAGN